MLHYRLSLYKNPIFWIVVGLTAIALLLGSGLAYFSADLGSLFLRQDNYRSYLDTTNDLRINLLNAETGQRGYLVTQDETYLEPYNHALPRIEQDLNTLANSPLSDPYKAEIKDIKRLTSAKMDELKQTIGTLRSQGQAAAIAIVSTNVGIDDMDTIRARILTITDAQRSRLDSDISAAKTRVLILEFLAPLVALLDIGLVLTIFVLTSRAIRREQELDNMKEQFVALASHQLRTPATAVKQYLSLLLGGNFGKLKKEQHAVLQKVSDSNDRGIKIANNLLNVTVIDSGKVTLSQDPINLGELLKHVLSHYVEAVKESRHQTIVVKLPKKQVLARFDQFQMRLIFDNLIENASKYSDDHKKITVRLKQSPEWITFSVKDEGLGISKKDVPQLFKRFSRLDEASRKAEGSGLGLYLVKKAAELHGGDVSVTSSPGKGSTFTIRIKGDL